LLLLVIIFSSLLAISKHKVQEEIKLCSVDRWIDGWMDRWMGGFNIGTSEMQNSVLGSGHFLVGGVGKSSSQY
jgi:hypothetical protein